MKKVLFSVIALTALGMTQAHAETHDKTAEFSVTEKAHVDPDKFGGGYGGFSRVRFDLERSKLNQRMQDNADIGNIGKDFSRRTNQITDKENNDKGQDRNRCGCGGGGGGNNLDQHFDREWHR